MIIGAKGTPAPVERPSIQLARTAPQSLCERTDKC
jgi:hypothetical protein